MKAKELAALLLKNPEDEVCVTTSNFEQGGSLKIAKGIHRFKGAVEKQTFRDAFDGETYPSEVIRIGGNTMFIQITSL